MIWIFQSEAPDLCWQWIWIHKYVGPTRAALLRLENQRGHRELKSLMKTRWEVLLSSPPSLSVRLMRLTGLLAWYCVKPAQSGGRGTWGMSIFLWSQHFVEIDGPNLLTAYSSNPALQSSQLGNFWYVLQLPKAGRESLSRSCLQCSLSWWECIIWCDWE